MPNSETDRVFNVRYYPRDSRRAREPVLHGKEKVKTFARLSPTTLSSGEWDGCGTRRHRDARSDAVLPGKARPVARPRAEIERVQDGATAGKSRRRVHRAINYYCRGVLGVVPPYVVNCCINNIELDKKVLLSFSLLFVFFFLLLLLLLLLLHISSSPHFYYYLLIIKRQNFTSPHSLKRPPLYVKLETPTPTPTKGRSIDRSIDPRERERERRRQYY